MLFEAAQTSRGIATVFMRLCCIAEWLVGESGRTIRKPLCHELVKLLDALVAGEHSRKRSLHQTFSSSQCCKVSMHSRVMTDSNAQEKAAYAKSICGAVFVPP